MDPRTDSENARMPLRAFEAAMRGMMTDFERIKNARPWLATPLDVNIVEEYLSDHIDRVITQAIIQLCQF
jgi:hypothetical protein